MNTYLITLDNDKDIINEFTSGNPEIAASSLVRKYQRFVYSTSNRYLQNHFDAEDLSQEIFIKAFSSLKNFRNESSLKTWLYRITVNMCISHIRKSKLRSFLKLNSNDEIDFDLRRNDVFKDTAVLPDRKMENDELTNCFLIELSRLPAKQRETFALRYFEEMTYEEISKLLGTSVGGLKANYFQAVKKLSVSLKQII